jgi:DNA polymerase I
MKIITELPPEPKKGELVSLDFETFGQTEGKLHRPNGTFACISINLERSPDTVYQLYDQNDLKKLVKVINKGTWVFHNSVYDLRQFRRYAEVKPRFIWDVMLLEQSMRGGYYQTFNLADCVRRWLNTHMEKEAREEFITRTELTPTMKRYAARDVVDTLKVALLQRSTYQDDFGFKAYLEADEPMIFPALDLKGFRVDVGKWTEMVNEFQAEATRLESELGINVKSPVQVRDAAKKQGLHLQDTSADTLIEYSDNPFIEQVILARRYRDAVSKYGLNWLEENVESDGLVYSNFHVTGADKTGRMSSSDPNIQNIPQRKLPQYRERFIASPGNVIDVSDVVQQEPCITAYHTQDRNLLESIRNKVDLHLAVARAIYDRPELTKEDKEERAIGKAINLGMVYGLSAFGLARKTGMTTESAERILGKYFQKFPGVFSWIQQQRQSAFRNGYVTTALGRKSYLNMYDRSWENNAINSPIQGGAADLTKRWARRDWELCRGAGIPFTTVAYVHDETVKDCPKEILKETLKIQSQSFTEAAEYLYKGVPFEIETVVGKSWAAKSLKSEVVEYDAE